VYYMGVEIVKVELGSFGDKYGASHCNQWGVCGTVVLCREGWRRGSSRITLEFFVNVFISRVAALAIANRILAQPSLPSVLSVRPSVGNERVLWKIGMPFVVGGRLGPRNHVVDRGPNPPTGRGNVWGKCGGAM